MEESHDSKLMFFNPKDRHLERVYHEEAGVLLEMIAPGVVLVQLLRPPFSICNVKMIMKKHQNPWEQNHGEVMSMAEKRLKDLILSGEQSGQEPYDDHPIVKMLVHEKSPWHSHQGSTAAEKESDAIDLYARVFLTRNVHFALDSEGNLAVQRDTPPSPPQCIREHYCELNRFLYLQLLSELVGEGEMVKAREGLYGSRLPIGKEKDDHWMEKAFAHSHGQLRHEEHTPAGQNINISRLRREKKTASLHKQRQIQLVLTARKSRLAKGGSGRSRSGRR
jgi:hypothetical protein